MEAFLKFGLTSHQETQDGQNCFHRWSICRVIINETLEQIYVVQLYTAVSTNMEKMAVFNVVSL